MADAHSSSKPRQPRLRASCDGCFTAKVKCSKARPICSRCLACGLECRYSPSSRAGKPRVGSHSSARQSDPFSSNPAGFPDDSHAMCQNYMTPMELYGLGTGWDSPPSLSPAISQDSPAFHEAAMCGVDDNIRNMGLAMYGMDMPPWMAEAEMQGLPLVDRLPGNTTFPFTNGGPSTSLAPPWTTLANGPPHGAQFFDPSSSPVSMGSNYFPSPAGTPNTPHRGQRPTDVACGCFNSCLQALYGLHNGLSVSSLDTTLFLTRKAVESCAGLLSCPSCTTRSGVPTTGMLMATILSKTAGIYKTAAQMQFDGTPNAGPRSSFPISSQRRNSGTRSQQHERPQAEILARQMERLREVCSLFHEVCGDLSDDSEVNRALVGHVGRTLGATMEAAKKMQTAWYN